MTRLTIRVSLVIVCAASPVEAIAQTWAGWSFHWENDTWVLPDLGSDDAFTNGIRLVLGRDHSDNIKVAGLGDFGKVWASLFTRDRDYDVTSALAIGQNFFTPRSITEFEPDSTDRPYAGLTYVGWRYDATRRLRIVNQVPADKQHQVQHSIELDFGVLGQGAGARLLQAGVHSVITTHRIPKGWSSQIQNSFAASLFYMFRSRWANRLWGSLQSDITFRSGGMLGTTQIYPMAGLTLRLGRGFSGFPGLLGRNTAVAPRELDTAQGRHTVELGVTGGVEGRYMAHNAFVEGAFGSRGNPGVAPERCLGELRLGLFLRILDVRLDYTYVRRSPEVAGEGPSKGAIDGYGSVSVAYEPGPETFDCGCIQDFFAETLPSWFSGFYLEVGFGDEIGSGGAATYRKNVMRGAVGRHLWKDLDIGFERSGVGREFNRPVTAGLDHQDRMLYLSAITLRYRPWGGRFGPFDLHFRGGRGFSATNEVELTPAATGVRTTPCPPRFTLHQPTHSLNKSYCNRQENGRGWLAGAGLALRPVGAELGILLDVLIADVNAGIDSSFWGWTLGMRWTPN